MSNCGEAGADTEQCRRKESGTSGFRRRGQVREAGRQERPPGQTQRNNSLGTFPSPPQIDITSAGGKLDAPASQRVFWCSLEGAVAIALLLGGGLKSLQAASLIAGLPFSVLLILMTVSIWKGIRSEAR